MLAEINKFTAEEYKQYKQSLENMGEFDNIIRTTEELAEQRGRELGRTEGHAEGRAEGLAEGRAEGHAEGHAEGRTEGQADTIRKMLAGGIPAEAIAAALGITTEECESYR